MRMILSTVDIIGILSSYIIITYFMPNFYFNSSVMVILFCLWHVFITNKLAIKFNLYDDFEFLD